MGVMLTMTLISGLLAAATAALVVDRVRVFPAAGQADKLMGGRVIASNSGETVGFVELARITKAPAEGEWMELKSENRTPYRWVKYEGPDDSHGVVAEVEFFAGDQKLTGKSFGVAGEREKGHSFEKALDGDTNTWFDAFLASGAYVGLDLGTAANVSATPALEARRGRLSVRGRGRIRYTTDGTVPTADNGKTYGGLITLGSGATVVTAIAFEEGKFPSAMASGVYTVGDAPPPKGLVTFSTGNSLSDTFNNGWLEPVCRSAGYAHKGYRFSVPGAPTDWLWTHPGSGFGRPDYARAFVELAPINVLITQPFAGHGRSIENEAQHTGNFYRLARESSPNIQLYLYQQWPARDFKDRWAEARGEDVQGLKPAETWEQGVANHLAYFERLRAKLSAEFPHKPVIIAPVGLAMVNLKQALEAGQIPGLAKDQFFELHYSGNAKGPGWDIHMGPKGAYFVSLVLYSCLYKEAPAKVNLPEKTTTLTAEQDRVYKRIAWDTVRGYAWAGVKPLPVAR